MGSNDVNEMLEAEALFWIECNCNMMYVVLSLKQKEK